jgi:hypothetical protein
MKFSKFKNKFPGDEARFLFKKLIFKNFLEMVFFLRAIFDNN